jgi:hypothetical protein
MNAINIEKLNQLISRTDISGNDKVKRITDFIDGRETIKQAFIAGAKWQAEKMYSEEDMKKAIRFGFDKGFCSNSSNKTKNLGLSEEEWFEQFKKKSVV